MEGQEEQKFVAGWLSQLGEELSNIEYLTNGATCTVWKVQSDRRLYAFRIINANERVLGSELDAHVRTEVSSAGGRVVEPVLNSHGCKTLFGGKRWSLDAFVHGTHPERGVLSDNVCRQLGETLAVLHDLPVKKFGKPNELSHGLLFGETTDPIEGVDQRFENPLPQIWPKKFTHPVLSRCSEIEAEILAHLNEVSNVVKEARNVLCHSDIHEKQLICNNDELTALIDFGDATILDKHWDFGSAYYFHGAKNTSSVIEAYESALGLIDMTMDTVASFSVAVAMHHGSRSRLIGKEHRLDRAVQHIRNVITQ